MRLILNVRKLFLLVLAGTVVSFTAYSQRYERILEVMDTAAIEGQLEYIDAHTNIYNGFRAVHEDIFRKLYRNTVDTVKQDRNQIQNLQAVVRERNISIDSLNLALRETNNNLNEAISSKNNLSFIGIEMDKTIYNTIVWSIILALLVLLVLGFFLFKRNIATTQNTRRDLEEIQKEFEEYRKTARERHEKLVISHFNEIKKLKEGGAG